MQEELQIEETGSRTAVIITAVIAALVVTGAVWYFFFSDTAQENSDEQIAVEITDVTNEPAKQTVPVDEGVNTTIVSSVSQEEAMSDMTQESAAKDEPSNTVQDNPQVAASVNTGAETGTSEWVAVTAIILLLSGGWLFRFNLKRT